MKAMRHTPPPLLTLLMLLSCSPRLTTVESRDSTVTTSVITYRDSMVSVPVPMERITAVTSLDTAIRLSTTIAEVLIRPEDNGRYSVDLRHREDARITTVIQIPMQHVTTVRESLRRETVTREVHTLRWWQKALIWTGAAAIAAAAAYLVWKIWGTGIASAVKTLGKQLLNKF